MNRATKSGRQHFAAGQNIFQRGALFKLRLIEQHAELGWDNLQDRDVFFGKDFGERGGVVVVFGREQH